DDQEDEKDGERYDDQQAGLGTLLALVLASPFDVVAGWKFDLLVDLADRFLDGAAEIPAAHAVLDADVARIGLAIERGSAIRRANGAKLAEGDALAGRGQQANVADRFPCIAVGRKVARHQVVALLAQQHLSDSVASHGSLDRFLYVRD